MTMLLNAITVENMLRIPAVRFPGDQIGGSQLGSWELSPCCFCLFLAGSNRFAKFVATNI